MYSENAIVVEQYQDCSLSGTIARRLQHLTARFLKVLFIGTIHLCIEQYM